MYRAQIDLEPEALRDLASITTTARMKFNTVADTARENEAAHTQCMYIQEFDIPGWRNPGELINADNSTPQPHWSRDQLNIVL